MRSDRGQRAGADPNTFSRRKSKQSPKEAAPTTTEVSAAEVATEVVKDEPAMTTTKLEERVASLEKLLEANQVAVKTEQEKPGAVEAMVTHEAQLAERAAQQALHRYHVGDMVDVDTEDGLEIGAVVVGKPESGDPTEMRVKFDDGVVDAQHPQHFFDGQRRHHGDDPFPRAHDTSSFLKTASCLHPASNH